MNLEQMRYSINQIFANFGSQSVFVGLQPTQQTIAGAVGLRLNIDSQLLQLYNPVVGMIVINEIYLKTFPDAETYFILAHECAHISRNHILSRAFWNLTKIILKGPNDKNRSIVYCRNDQIGVGITIERQFTPRCIIDKR